MKNRHVLGTGLSMEIIHLARELIENNSRHPRHGEFGHNEPQPTVWCIDFEKKNLIFPTAPPPPLSYIISQSHPKKSCGSTIGPWCIQYSLVQTYDLNGFVLPVLITCAILIYRLLSRHIATEVQHTLDIKHVEVLMEVHIVFLFKQILSYVYNSWRKAMDNLVWWCCHQVCLWTSVK
jgi:hypothetical protein